MTIIAKRLMANLATMPPVLAMASIVAIWPALGYGEDTAPGQGSQQIQLDPETGEVLQPSFESTPQPARRARESGESADSDGPRAWTTADGVQMLTPDPADAPMARATQCPDGSLRIGHAEAQEGESARAALCGAAGE